MNLTGYSTALFSTWYFVEDYGVLFDAGDGVIAHLLQKAMKAKYIFITHPDRDHLTGLTQLVQLNSRDGFPKIYYPKDCGSFPALSAFLASFDPHTSGSEWIGIEEGTEIQVGKDLIVKPIANDHVRKVGVKSLSYQLIRTKRKLKPEFLALTHKEILQQKQTIGEEAMTEEVRQILLSYSGDTPVSHDGRWQGSEVLIHEATFLHKYEADNANPRANRHSSLEEVMQMVSQTSVGKLVLGHFSSRYSEEEIGKAINTFATQFGVKIPIYALLPSVCLKDILKN
ncbi:MAG: RNAse Z [Bacteroidetes bacterium]|nr:MAG: RNAse Z [Bacteroidota bacterium]